MTPARVTQFLRSLLPADLFQLCFLAGLVCFTIAPHLRWWPIAQNVDLSAGLNASPEPIGLYAVRVAAAYGFALAASAGYFFCLWPGKRPVLKVGLLVLVPAVLSSGANIAESLHMRAGSYSILQQSRGASFSWAAKEIWPGGVGMHFAILGIVLTGIFLTRLLSGGRSLLPVTPKSDRTVQELEVLGWKGVRRLVWFAAAPLATILTALLGLPVLLLLSRVTASLNENTLTWVGWFQNLLSAGVMLAVALLFAGRDNWKSLWSGCKLPEPRAIVVAATLPAIVMLLPAVAHYLLNRAHWAASDFGRYSPPQFLNYLPVPALWMVGLVFGAFAEEVIFRGILQQHFVQRYGIWRGIFLVGLIWSAIHFSSDRYTGLSDMEVALRLVHRIVTCMAMGFVLSWLTLRSGSLIPATVAHWLSNVGIFSSREPEYTGIEWARTLMWLLVALVLYRFWPIPQPELEELPVIDSDAEPAAN